MSEAPVTVINERKEQVKLPHLKPYKTLNIAFDGNHDQSVIINKSGFAIVELHFPVLLSAGDVTFKVAMNPVLSEFQALQDVAIDGSLGAKGTTELAGYPYMIVVPAVLEEEAIQVSLFNP